MYIYDIPLMDTPLKSANAHLYPLIPFKRSNRVGKPFVTFHKMLAFRRGKINATTHVIII